MERTPSASRRVCIAVVVDADELDDLLKRLALGGLVPASSDRAADPSPSSERLVIGVEAGDRPELPLLAWPRVRHVVAFLAVGAFGVALGFATEVTSRADGRRRTPTHEGPSARVAEVERARFDAGVVSKALSTGPPADHTGLSAEPPRRPRPRTPTPSASRAAVPRPTIPSPRAEVRGQADAAFDGSDYIREL